MRLVMMLLILFGGLFLYVFSQPTLWGPLVYPLQYREIVKSFATQYSLEPNLVAAVIYAESRFLAGQESRAGALGLMQLLPTTAESIARSLGDNEYTSENLLEPKRNIRYGTYYLKYLLDKYGGDLDLALAAYNAGETNVDRWQKQGMDDFPFQETRDFVAKVRQAKSMYDRIYGKWYEE